MPEYQVQVWSDSLDDWSELGHFPSEEAANAWIAEHAPSGACVVRVERIS